MIRISESLFHSNSIHNNIRNYYFRIPFHFPNSHSIPIANNDYVFTNSFKFEFEFVYSSFHKLIIVQLVQSIPDAAASNAAANSANNNNHNNTSDLFLVESGMGSPSIASTSEDEAALRHDIQRTLTTLQDLVTTQLQPKAEKLGKSILVKRYREILFDLSGDFEKSRLSHTRKVERSKLFENANANNANSSHLNMDQNGMDHLMRERNHIHNSQSAAASVVHQATEIRNELRNQGTGLGRAQNLVGQIATNIPGINTLVEQIRKKRSRDDMVVIGVIASCILFTLWYLFH